jgi:hypothetical protein
MSASSPLPPTGGTRPELRAAITAATEAVSDFTRETDTWIASKGDRPLWESLAWALHTRLRMLLQAIAGSREGPSS